MWMKKSWGQEISLLTRMLRAQGAEGLDILYIQLASNGQLLEIEVAGSVFHPRLPAACALLRGFSEALEERKRMLHAEMSLKY